MANLFLNNVNEKMLHSQQGAKGEFYNVSFGCDKSASGLATVSVNKGQVLTATRKDGSTIDGYKSVLLGKPETKRLVSVQQADGTYASVEMTNAEIEAAYAAARAAYRAAKAE